MILTPYIDVRSLMLPGDLLAFGGKSWLSRGIKLITRSPVSHVATVVHHQRAAGEPYKMVAQSSTGGVTLQRLSKVIDSYDGDVWWLPLTAAYRGMLDIPKFTEFLLAQEGKGFDDLQMWLQPLGIGHDDFDKFYCAELVSAALKAGGLVDLRPHHTTPIELCRFPIFSAVSQIKGEPTELNRG